MSLVDRGGLFAPLPSPRRWTRSPRSSARPAASGPASPPARPCSSTTARSSTSPSCPPRSWISPTPEWAGPHRRSRPTGADFQAIVSAVVQLEGEDATRGLAPGHQGQRHLYDGNNVVLESVNAGEIPGRDHLPLLLVPRPGEAGEISDNSALHYFARPGPRRVPQRLGRRRPESSDTKAEARQFVEFLNGTDGQQVLADSYALEYPLNPDVPLDPPRQPFDELEPPVVNVSDLDGQAVVDLMTEVGFL